MNSSIFVKNSLNTIIEMLIDRKILTSDYKYKYSSFFRIIRK